MTIWKFPLKIDDYQAIEVPFGARPLTVAMQRGVPCLWALIDETEGVTDSIVVRTVGTGHPITDQYGQYVGTYQPTDDLVFHVFWNA